MLYDIVNTKKNRYNEMIIAQNENSFSSVKYSKLNFSAVFISSSLAPGLEIKPYAWVIVIYWQSRSNLKIMQIIKTLWYNIMIR